MGYTHFDVMAKALPPVGFTVPLEENTAGNVTYSMAQFLGGLITRSLSAADRSDTTPTAVAIIAALGGPSPDKIRVGNSFEVVIRNDAPANTLTILGGTGVTIDGTATIPADTAKRFRVVVTSLTTVKMYSLGASTF